RARRLPSRGILYKWREGVIGLDPTMRWIERAGPRDQAHRDINQGESTMITPKRAAANRRNAERSTGPKTPEGKNRSRFNALKLGMAAKLPVLPGEDAEAYQARIETWTADLRPRNDVERDLVQRAARASWQLERAVFIQAVILTERIRAEASDDAQAAD